MLTGDRDREEKLEIRDGYTTVPFLFFSWNFGHAHIDTHVPSVIFFFNPPGMGLELWSTVSESTLTTKLPVGVIFLTSCNLRKTNIISLSFSFLSKVDGIKLL